MSGGAIVRTETGFSLYRAHLHDSWVDSGGAEHDDEGFGLYDLTVENGRIASIPPSVAASEGAENDLRRRVVLPALID